MTAKTDRGQARRGTQPGRASAEGLGKQPLPLGAAVAEGEALLDKVAVAQRMGMKPRTVGDWVRRGELPAYRLGRYLRFRWTEVEAHLAATCQVGANAESRNRKSTAHPNPLPVRGGEGAES